MASGPVVIRSFFFGKRLDAPFQFAEDLVADVHLPESFAMADARVLSDYVEEFAVFLDEGQVTVHVGDDVFPEVEQDGFVMDAKEREGEGEHPDFGASEYLFQSLMDNIRVLMPQENAVENGFLHVRQAGKIVFVRKSAADMGPVILIVTMIDGGWYCPCFALL